MDKFIKKHPILFTAIVLSPLLIVLILCCLFTSTLIKFVEIQPSPDYIDGVIPNKNNDETIYVKALCSTNSLDLKINNQIIKGINNQGLCTKKGFQYKLNDGENVITIELIDTNGNVITSTNSRVEYKVSFNKTLYEEKIALEAKQRLLEEQKAKDAQLIIEQEEKKRLEEEKKLNEEAIKKEQQLKAEAETAWNNSGAGKICLTHPLWTKEDCTGLANNRIWIGMTLEMLKYKRGNPNSTNPSNYGNGNRWQWCWWNYTPSCFYDNNDDGYIDSYN